MSFDLYSARNTALAANNLITLQLELLGSRVEATVEPCSISRRHEVLLVTVSLTVDAASIIARFFFRFLLVPDSSHISERVLAGKRADM